MEPKPIIVVTSSKSVSKRRALKAIDLFLELHEEEKTISTDVTVERYRISAIPEDVIMSLVKVKTFLIEDVTQSSSSAMKIEAPKGIKSVEKLGGSPVISGTKIKREDEEAPVTKKSKKTVANDDHTIQKKKKARL